MRMKDERRGKRVRRETAKLRSKGKVSPAVVGNPALKHCRQCRAPAAEVDRRIRGRQSQLVPNFIDQLLDWRSLQANASPWGSSANGNLGEMTPTMSIRSKRDWRGLDHIIIQSLWLLEMGSLMALSSGIWGQAGHGRLTLRNHKHPIFIMLALVFPSIFLQGRGS